MVSPAALGGSVLGYDTKPLSERATLDYSYNDYAKIDDLCDEIYTRKIAASDANECDRQGQEIEALEGLNPEFIQLFFPRLNEVERQKVRHLVVLSLFLRIIDSFGQLESLLLHLYNRLTKTTPIIIGDDGYTKYGGSIVLAIVDGNSARLFKIKNTSLVSCSVIAFLEINRDEEANLDFYFSAEGTLALSAEDGDSVSIKEKSLVVIGERNGDEDIQLLIRQYCGPVDSNSEKIKLAYYKDGSHKEENLPVGDLVGVVVGALSFEDTKEILSIYDAPEIVFPQRKLITVPILNN